LALDGYAGADYRLVAPRFFGGNQAVAKHYIEQHEGQNRLDKSGFARRLHALPNTLLALFALVGEVLKHLHLEARYVLDSFLVVVCHKMRQKQLSRVFHAVSC
jgi:hypothetical protein